MSKRSRTRGANMAQRPIPPAYQDIGVTYENGHYRIPEKGMLAKSLELIMQSATTPITSQQSMSRVPSVPRYLIPDVAGQGVSKTAHGFYENVTFAQLRQYGRKVIALMKLYAACEFGIRSHCKIWDGQKGNVGFQVVHKDTFKTKEIPKGYEKIIAKIEDRLTSPFEGDGLSPKCLTLADLVVPAYHDLFDINRPVFEKIKAGDELVGVRPVDGSLVLETWDMLSRWAGDHNNLKVGAYDLSQLNGEERLDALSEHTGHDLVTAEYVIYRDGIVDGVYKPGRLIVLPMQNTTDIYYFGYPPSYVERALEVVAAYWNVWDYTTRRWTEGMWANFVLAVIGDGYQLEDFNAFMGNFREATQGYRRAGKPPMIKLPDGGDLKTVPLEIPKTEMEFQQFISYLESSLCAIVRRDPSVINGKPWDGGQGSTLSAPSRDFEISLSKAEGHKTDVTHFAEMLTLVARDIDDNARVVAQLGDYDPQKEAAYHVQLVTHTRTRNEVRVAMGDTAIGFFMTAEDLKNASPEHVKEFNSNPWNWPDSQVFGAHLQAAMGLQKGAEDAANGPPKLDENGKPPPSSPTTPDHFPGLNPPKIDDAEDEPDKKDNLAKGHRHDGWCDLDSWENY